MKRLSLNSALLCIFFPIILLSQTKAGKDLSIIAETDEVWTGVAVTNTGRIFVNYPRWSPDVRISVAELNADGDNFLYPDFEWNTFNDSINPADHFICVQSVYADEKNNLWILDTGNPFLQGVIKGGAKLIKIDLNSDSIEQIIYFDSTSIENESYLNDVRIDHAKNYAYITDSGTGALVVVNLKTGRIMRRLTRHSSVKAENIVLNVEGVKLRVPIHSDGIALDNQNEFLYYQALSGRHLYKISTNSLIDTSLTSKELGKKVISLGETCAADGIEFADDGYLYITAIEQNAIYRFSGASGLEEVIADESIKWPDSISITQSGKLYFTISQLHLGPNRKETNKIFVIDIGG